MPLLVVAIREIFAGVRAARFPAVFGVIVGARGTPAVVNAQTCTGCGQCAQICPARALRIEDRRESERAGAARQPTTA